MESLFRIIQKDLRISSDKNYISCLIKAFFSTSGFKMVLCYRLSHWCYFHKIKFCASFFSWLIKLRYASDINPTAVIGGGLFFPHPLSIVIGGGVILGEYCTIGQGVTLGGNFKKNINGRKRPIVGSRCFICVGSVVMGPVDIGDDVIIGANSVVTQSFGSGLVLAGNPARIIRYIQNEESPVF
ncbi:serine O-acetyltransferase [Phocaeicola sp.]